MDYDIFRFIYINSMRDAVRQRAYAGEGIEPKKRLEERALMDALIPHIKPLVNGALHNNFELSESYNAAFLKATINICDTINRDPRNHFDFGNAQKLVNMILKYFFITTYNHGGSREGFKFCHCPMDQQLLEIVWNNRNHLNNPNSLGNRSDFLKSWGNEVFLVVNEERTLPNRYILFQTAVQELCASPSFNENRLIPLEFDYYMWGLN